MLKRYLITLFCLGALNYANSQASGFDIKNLLPGKVHQSQARNGYSRLSIYCYKGVSKHILHFWQTVRLVINIEGDDWDLYIGDTSASVMEEHEAKRSIWSFNLPFRRKSDTLYLDPFNSTCLGVYTSKDHSVYLHILRIDFWRVLMFLSGLLIFLTAPKLSSNPIFYYSCGISIGISMSFLIVIYCTSRFIPKRPAVLGFLAGGWAIGVYIIKLVLNNMRTIALLYQHYVLGYITISALISFAICYRYGPVSNPRTMSLIRWFLKGIGLGAIFFSSSYSEASMGVIIILIVYENFPMTWINAFTRFWHTKFPAKVKPLTEEEYHEQGARETIKALEELRKYCSSPECNQWKTVLKLQRPIRFAEFMEGRSHLKDDELLEYESDVSKPVFTDDSDSED